jgi:hypothetical protein
MGFPVGLNNFNGRNYTFSILLWNSIGYFLKRDFLNMIVRKIRF